MKTYVTIAPMTATTEQIIMQLRRPADVGWAAPPGPSIKGKKNAPVAAPSLPLAAEMPWQVARTSAG